MNLGAPWTDVKLKVVISPGPDGGFVASCPALPGCHSQSDTKKEALANIREAIKGCLGVLNERASIHQSVDQVVEVEV